MPIFFMLLIAVGLVLAWIRESQPDPPRFRTEHHWADEDQRHG